MDYMILCCIKYISLTAVRIRGYSRGKSEEQGRPAKGMKVVQAINIRIWITGVVTGKAYKLFTVFQAL